MQPYRTPWATVDAQNEEYRNRGWLLTEPLTPSPQRSPTSSNPDTRPQKTLTQPAPRLLLPRPHSEPSLNNVGFNSSQVSAQGPFHMASSGSGAAPKRLKTWEPAYLLQDKRSKLAKVDLSAVLLDPRAWTSLDVDEKRSVWATVPRAPPYDEIPEAEHHNVLLNLLHNNTVFRSDVQAFQSNIKDGFHHPQWQQEAQRAMQRRAQGDFDEHQRAQFERTWGPQQAQGNDGEFTNVLKGIRLGDLMKTAQLRNGDQLVYHRTFKLPKGSVTVEKAVTLVNSQPADNPSFCFPAGTARNAAPDLPNSLVSVRVKHLVELVRKLIEADGRVGSVNLGSAWDNFTVFRNGENIGTMDALKRTCARNKQDVSSLTTRINQDTGDSTEGQV